MPTILGANFGGEFFRGPDALEKQGRKICWKTSLEEFAEKFAGNVLKIRQAKIRNPTPTRSAELKCKQSTRRNSA